MTMKQKVDNNQTYASDSTDTIVEELLLGGKKKCKRPSSLDLENEDFVTRALNAKVPSSVYSSSGQTY